MSGQKRRWSFVQSRYNCRSSFTLSACSSDKCRTCFKQAGCNVSTCCWRQISVCPWERDYKIF